MKSSFRWLIYAFIDNYTYVHFTMYIARHYYNTSGFAACACPYATCTRLFGLTHITRRCAPPPTHRSYAASYSSPKKTKTKNNLMRCFELGPPRVQGFTGTKCFPSGSNSCRPRQGKGLYPPTCLYPSIGLQVP